MSHWEPTLGASNEWYTPPHIFTALGCTFDLDVAHPPPPTRTHVPTSGKIYDNSLSLPWRGFIWMDPPFEGRNGLAPWLTKFFGHGNGIALVPDRTSALWFHEAWINAECVLFTPKIKFIRPDGSEGKSPSNGTALMAVGERGCAALKRAAAKGLGILAIPTRSEPSQ